MIERFLDLLSKEVPLTGENKDRIRAVCAKDRKKFLEPVCDTRLVSESQALRALGLLYGLPFMEELPLDHLKNEFTGDISRKFLKAYSVAPLIRDGQKGIIAVNDPSDLSVADETARLAGITAHSLVLAPKNQILLAINMLYDHTDGNVQQLVDDMEENDSLVIEDMEETADLLDDSGDDAPVIRLVNQMISKAAKAGASDIHIEPFQEVLKVRYRIDGIVYEMMTPPKLFQSALVSRIKVMAKMNIAEKRVPQDGRAQVRLGNQEIDLRISTVPTTYGERLVMRLLNKSGSFMSISEFGFSQENEALFRRIIRQNHGIVLVTGPTGSGKTTTLYAGLSEINTPDKTIITIEDPVEYNLQGIGQIQVNQKTGVTFAKGLRSIVRQDPDVILIGEIRDVETAEIAIQSALTGHLVFSTLHTNDAPGSVTRLVDLGVEPYLISSSVNHIIAQRLVRVLCPHCKEAYLLGEPDIKSLNGMGEEMLGRRVFKPGGCARCFNTGYSGRQAIVEILALDDELKTLVLQTSDANRIREPAIEKGMVTLRRDGMKKVMDGITSIREVLRVTQE